MNTLCFELHWYCAIQAVWGGYTKLAVQAWKQDHLDLAATWYNKAISNEAFLHGPNSERLTDLLFEIGEYQIQKKNFEDAVQWLERGDDVMLKQSSDNLSDDAQELKATVRQTLTRALIGVGSPEAINNAWNLIADLETVYGDKLAILITKLDLLEASPEVASQDLCATLLKIIRTAHLTKATVETVLRYAHKLRLRSSTSTHVVLKTFLAERLTDAAEQDWIERVLVFIAWNVSTSNELSKDPSSLEEALDIVAAHSKQPLSSKAICSSQTVQDRLALLRKQDFVLTHSIAHLEAGGEYIHS